MKFEIKKAAVIGYPISHSLSPVIHKYWIEKYGIDATYEAISVKPEELEAFIRALPEKGFTGVNVTIPHKEKVFHLLQQNALIEGLYVDKIKAVNTVTVTPDGNIIGTNTDDHGFLQNLQGSDLYHNKYQKVLILGAGGATRAVCVGLIDILSENSIIKIANRTREKAEKLAFEMRDKRIQVIGWEDINSQLNDISLLVNTTSLGMKGQEKLEILLDNLPISAIVTDIVYNPLETELLRQARLRGNTTIDGLGMLLYQAQQAFYLWFGILPEVNDTLRALVLRHMR